MRRSPKLYLADIQMHGGRALDYIAGLSLTRYSSSQKTKDAVERNLFIVGEAVTQLRNSYPDVAEQLRGAPDIVAFRNVLAHGYSVVDDAIVWQVLQDWLPKLLADAKHLETTIEDI
jgi:uncharacterized protein with HEPN domain